MKTTPVIFRMEPEGDVVAVFPTQPANPGRMVCYAHIGQHTECSHEWLLGTRPAKPEEYADLLEELESIYSRPDDPGRVELKVYRRMRSKWSEERWS